MKAVLIGAWIASSVAGFWWYDGRYRLPVSALPATRPAIASRWIVPGAKVTLLSFYTPGCGCSRFAESHIAALAKRYGSRGLRVVTIVEGVGHAPEYDRVVYDGNGSIARALGVAAAPGAVVLDEKGRTVYTGGFNVARFCDDAKTAFAEQAIQATLESRQPTTSHGAFYGCATVAAG